MNKIKENELLKHIWFALSACVFILMGTKTFLSACLSVLSFFVFFFVSYKITLSNIDIKKKHWIILLPLCCFIVILRCQNFFTALNNSNKIDVIFSLFHMNGMLGSIIITTFACLISLYSLLHIFNLICESSFNNQLITRIKSNGVIVLLLIISILFTLCISSSTPLINQLPSGDHSIFYIIGKSWSQGYLPYIDLFDHKGPLIFFIYMLGYMIDKHIGIYILQTIALWISLCFAYKIVEWKCKFNKYAVITIVSILVFLIGLNYGDALTEEFNLPFLMISAYLAQKYLKNYDKNKPCHNPIWAGFHGLAFGVAFCTRLTNAIAVTVWVAVIVILLLMNKEFLNLLYNAIAFIIGFCIVFLPFAIYFALNGALYDMMYGTIIYNILYAGSGSWDFNIGNLLNILLYTWPAWILVSLSVLYRNKTNKPLIIANVIAVICSLYIVSSGYLFAHYFIILTVFIPVNMVYISELLSENKLMLNYKLVIPFLCVIVAVPCLTDVINNTRTYMKEYEQSDFEIASNEIISYIPEEDYDSIIGYNTSSLFYLYTDIVPCFKYFTLQDFQSSNSEQMVNENVDFYNSKQAKWIIIADTVDNEEISDAIYNNYTYYDEVSYINYDTNSVLLLYKRND